MLQGTKSPFSIDRWSDLVSRAMYCSFAILYISAFRRALATGRKTVHCSLSLCVVDQARRICARLSVGVRNMTVFSCKHPCSCSWARPLLHDGRPCEERVHSHTLCELLTDDSSLSSGLTLGTPAPPNFSPPRVIQLIAYDIMEFQHRHRQREVCEHT